MPDNLMCSPFLYNLSLTLIHFIWQGFFVALALKLALTFTSYKKPQWRYAFSSLAMVANLLLPLFTFFIIYQPDLQQFSPLLNNSMLLGDVINNDTHNTAVWYATTVEFLPYLSLAWVTISFALAVKLFIELYNVNQIPKTGTSPADAVLEARFYQLVEQVKLKCTPRVLISIKNDVPMAIGWLKPVVLIPVSMLSGLTPAQLDMLILHELAHIRRHDYLVNFMQTLVEIFLFFHPGVRWVSKQMRNEREYCSDDIAVQHCGNPVAYAHTLADTASICDKHRHHSIPAMAMAASGGDLKQRVVRLIDQNHHCSTTNNSGKWLASIAIIFSIIVVGSKKYIQLPTLDLSSGTISLYRSPDDTFRISSDLNDKKELPALAQQLLHQENESDALETKLPENLAFPQAQGIFINNAIGITTEGQKAPKVDIARKNYTQNNRNKNNNTVIISAQELAKKIIPIEKPVIVPVITLAKNLGRSVNKSPFSDSQQTIEKSLPKLTLAKEAVANKSISELAFERTDSTRVDSVLNNPYAQQVASLANEPTNINVQLEMPTRTRSNIIEQVLPTTNNSATHVIPTNSPAQLVTSVYPKYPSNAKRKGIETDIEVTFTIDTDGYVRDIEYDGKGKVSYFRNTIRSSLKKWRFTPASYNDQPIESTMSKIFSFSIAK
jgi:TonB family protein